MQGSSGRRSRRHDMAIVAATAMTLALPGAMVWPAVASPQSGQQHGADSASGRSPGTTAVRVLAAASEVQLTTALAQARPGDRIEVADGVYSYGPIRLTRSGTADAPITITARHPGGAEIRGAAGFALTGASHVVIEGFQFNGTGL